MNELRDSRRLTGPGLVLDRPGAVIDVSLDEADDHLIDAWAASARGLLDLVGWRHERIAIRRFRGGASLAFTAPIDALYSATELNEAAWDLAHHRGEAAAVAERLRSATAAEARPRLRSLATAAAERAVTFLSDDALVSVGSGTGAQVWPVDDLPTPDQVDWSRVHDVPRVLVTGSNGKTTTVRLIAAMAAASGRVAGLTSTDGVWVGDEVLEAGDLSGPGGARQLLRDRRVQIAVLETARGGLLRRGLAVPTAEAAVVTNIADDHLGEFGIGTLDELADAKLAIARAVIPGGSLVLNADDPTLALRSATLDASQVLAAVDRGRPLALAHAAGGGQAALLEDDSLVFRSGASVTRLLGVSEVPIALGGAARHNLANALCAIGAASALLEHLGPTSDAAWRTVARALASFSGDPTTNPGRGNLMELDGVRVLLDYAHNPHGLAALAGIVDALPAARRALVLGQAGDRTDDALRDLARAALALRPDFVVLKELHHLRRGRPEGEVRAVLADELRKQGLPPAAVAHAENEVAAARTALAWARPGDLVILLVHEDRGAVMQALDSLGTAPLAPSR